MHRALICLIFCLALFNVPNGARADMRLCNETSYVLQAAASVRQGVVSKTEGWIEICPAHAPLLWPICPMMRKPMSMPNQMKPMPVRGWF